MYTLIIRPCIPNINCASQTKIKKLQAIQKRFLRIALKTPMAHAKQTTLCHWNTIPDHMDQRPISKFSFKISLIEGAFHFKIGEKTKNRRLKSCLPQDALLLPELSSSSSVTSDQ